MGGYMGQWVGSGQMTNLIKLELINIIWFCLKIYSLSRHPYLWVDGWVNGWAHVKPLKSNKSWPNRDNSIMDILDILLDILLKPPQPFIGLFFTTLKNVDMFKIIEFYWFMHSAFCGWKHLKMFITCSLEDGLLVVCDFQNGDWYRMLRNVSVNFLLFYHNNIMLKTDTGRERLIRTQLIRSST